jgi:DNA modification methylase
MPRRARARQTKEPTSRAAYSARIGVLSVRRDTLTLVNRGSVVKLSWEGKDAATAPATSGDRAAIRRAWTTPDASGWLLEGENLQVLRALAASHPGSVTLAYLDPPFFTKREHAAWLRKAGSVRGSARIRVAAFDDRWPDFGSWLGALGARLVATREMLARHGSIVVHVDPKTSHYVKVLGDEIFGASSFASEIIWRYRRWPSKTRNFQRVHDVLLRWRMDPDTLPRWNQPYEPLAASTLATWGTSKQRALFRSDGRRLRSSSTDEPTAGVPMGDVWDIGVIAPIARERTGYPSQKPEALLDRLVEALTNPGDTVLDPYAGSGTSLVVAHRTRRAFVGIDDSPVALSMTLERFDKVGTPLTLKPTFTEAVQRGARGVVA